MRAPAGARRPTSDAVPVTWGQVAGFRLDRHHLLERAPASSLRTVLADMAGAQAQLLSAAELSLWARVRELPAGALENALWKHRRLAKAWCMRRTLYLLPSNELAMFVRGSARRAEKEIRWVLNRGVPARTLDRLLSATLAALDEPRTRTELAERVGRSLRRPTGQEPGGGWGSGRLIQYVSVGGINFHANYLLHLAGARGVICSGPNYGNEATYVRADGWLRPFHDIPPDRAEEQLLRRYLSAFGPGTVRDFVAWTRMRFADAEGIWSRIDGELSEVDLEGDPAWLLRRDVPDLLRAEVDGGSVRLLPYFDSYLLGHMDRGHLLETKHHRRVYRAQGWVAPVVLIDGRVVGVWSYDVDGPRLRVRVEPFVPTALRAAPRIRKEVESLARFLGATQSTTRFAASRAS